MFAFVVDRSNEKMATNVVALGDEVSIPGIKRDLGGRVVFIGRVFNVWKEIVCGIILYKNGRGGQTGILNNIPYFKTSRPQGTFLSLSGIGINRGMYP